jgi:hypothetical protein
LCRSHISHGTWGSTIDIWLVVLRIRIRDPVPFWLLDPGSWILNRFFPDTRSRILVHPYFWELNDNFLGKKLYNSLLIDPVVS